MPDKNSLHDNTVEVASVGRMPPVPGRSTGSTQEEKRRVYRFPSGGAAFGGGIGGLAATGIDPSWWIIGGLLSVIVGVFLVRSARRASASRHRKH